MAGKGGLSLEKVKKPKIILEFEKQIRYNDCYMRRLNQEAMIEKLIQRERNRQRKHGYSGIMVGDEAKLMGIADKSRLLKPKFTITIAQPGVSKSLVSNEQLELLASTEKYIKDSGGKTPLIVITSE